MTLHLTFSYVTAILLVVSFFCFVAWFVVESAYSPGGILFARKNFRVSWWDRFTAKFFMVAALGCLGAAFWTMGAVTL